MKYIVILCMLLCGCEVAVSSSIQGGQDKVKFGSICDYVFHRNASMEFVKDLENNICFIFSGTASHKNIEIIDCKIVDNCLKRGSHEETRGSL